MSRDGTTAVFHALRPIPVFLNTDSWNQYKKKPEEDDELRHGFLNQGILVNDSTDDDALRDEIREMTLSRKMMSILYLVLTKACNFRCRQCFQYERHLDIHPELSSLASLMTVEVARAGIDSFARHINGIGKGVKDRKRGQVCPVENLQNMSY